MITGVHHVAISTPDADRLIAFYARLGFEKVFDGAWQPGHAAADALTNLDGSGARQVMLKASNLYLELFEFASPPPKPANPERSVHDHGITHVCLTVDCLDDEHRRLEADGVPFQSEPQDLGAGVLTVYARDPDGNVVELKELVGGARHPFALPAP